ncbi:MAG: hypothetical protein QNK20_12590 [Aureibaculum sp.]|nr:hypothetical protein [Aureibaculum sp.]
MEHQLGTLAFDPGAFINVIIAWIYDITPGGMRRTKPIWTSKDQGQHIHWTDKRTSNLQSFLNKKSSSKNCTFVACA